MEKRLYLLSLDQPWCLVAAPGRLLLFLIAYACDPENLSILGVFLLCGENPVLLYCVLLPCVSPLLTQNTSLWSPCVGFSHTSHSPQHQLAHSLTRF